MAAIFLSHSSQDSSIAKKIGLRLENEGFSVWCFEREFKITEDHIKTSIEEVSKSQYFLLLVSKKAIINDKKNKYMYQEIIRANETDSTFIPIFYNITFSEINEIEPSWAMIIKSRSTGIEISDNNLEIVVRKIVRELKESVGRNIIEPHIQISEVSEESSLSRVRKKVGPPSILLVEDSAQNSAMAEMFLKRMAERSNVDIGEIFTVRNGEAAIDYCIGNSPRMVIMDVGLEGSIIDGITAGSIINNILNIPIIFWTGHAALYNSLLKECPAGILLKPATHFELWDEFTKSLIEWYNHIENFNLGKKNNTNILLSENGIRTFLESPDPMILMRTSLEVIMLNEASEILIGIPKANAFLRNIGNFLNIYDAPRKGGLSGLVKKSLSKDIVIQFSNGLHRAFDIEVKKVLNWKGEHHGYCMRLMDPSRKRVE